MATLNSTEIPFSAAHQQQPFKLLELPPELLQLLESDNPPTLCLNSSTPSIPTAAAHAILSVPGGKTYRVQQKNSSNPIMLIEPCMSTPVTDNPAIFIPCPGLRRISTIEDTLELYVQQSEAAAPPVKVNKWHEKFAKSRSGNNSKD